MSQFTPPIAMRLGFNNLWKFNYGLPILNFLDLYLRLKYFFLINDMLLVGCKIYRLTKRILLYITYFKYLTRPKKKPLRIKRIRAWPALSPINKIRFYNFKKKKLNFFFLQQDKESLFFMAADLKLNCNEDENLNHENQKNENDGTENTSIPFLEAEE